MAGSFFINWHYLRWIADDSIFKRFSSPRLQAKTKPVRDIDRLPPPSRWSISSRDRSRETPTRSRTIHAPSYVWNAVVERSLQLWDEKPTQEFPTNAEEGQFAIHQHINIWNVCVCCLLNFSAFAFTIAHELGLMLYWQLSKFHRSMSNQATSAEEIWTTIYDVVTTRFVNSASMNCR